MADRLQLSREQLAKILPDHNAVKVFEALLRLVDENLPIDESELAAVVGSGNSTSTGTAETLRRKVEEIEQLHQRVVNLDPLIKRLEFLEDKASVIAKRPVNLQVLESRTESLEKSASRRTVNLQPLETRIAALEAFLGVRV